MSTVQQCTFVITREDRAEDPKTIISEGLRIGRLPDSDLWLNHPKVSRLHAGISRIEGYFYLINLSASSATTLNGRVIPFNEAEALTTGDEIQIGPYFMQVENSDGGTDTLRLRVGQQFALAIGERESPHKIEKYKRQLASRVTGALKVPTGALEESVDRQKVRSGTGGLSDLKNSLQVFWSKRTREKAGRQSPLHPRTPPSLGKIRFNWKPTRDLVRPWPFAIFIWAVIVVGAFAAFAVFAHKNAFAPDSISDPHTRKTFALLPAIAKQANGNSCTSCHALEVSVANREKMNANCAACHHTEAFEATIIRAHRAAGLTCTTCHTEHRGEQFRPLNWALESCAKCHNDQNKNLYNGKSVHTAHGGTYGYPVKDKVWIWTGLDAEELAARPEVEAFLKKNRINSSQTQEWRSAQFHGIHLNHVRIVTGVEGILDEDGVTKVLSCSSCHLTGYMGTTVDRQYPHTTCSRCHNAQVFNEPSTAAPRDQTASCTSCHVQHTKDAHWASTFFKAKTEAPNAANSNQEQHR
ncbi:MAG: FHA domain-containing protein [Acidobacteriota bacterium]|nr:FHA domain-containing protein [Acidobacteriota bacterium]